MVARSGIVGRLGAASTPQTVEQRDFQLLTQAEMDAKAAEAVRRASLDTAINSDATIATLKAMTNDEFNTWWDANVTNAAQAIAVLKRVVRVLLRKVL